MTQHAIVHSSRLCRCKRRVITVMVCFMLATYGAGAWAADFLKPTAEELSMTSLKGYPGVPAVILYREEITKDDLHVVQHYERLKVLTDEGKRYANVELGYVSSTGGVFVSGDNKVLEDISGRTIHADGTMIPFTGKPYLKVLEKSEGYKIQQKVFTLPDVEVGSIIEYRYNTRINDNIYESPTWMIQDDLYVREAHFAWWPTNKSLIDEDQRPITTISWFPVLPVGAKIESHEMPGSSLRDRYLIYELHVKDVPPRVKEEHMPPIGSFSYRVNFSFTPYRTGAEYWQNVGKQWSKRVNAFTGPSKSLREMSAKVTADASTPDAKLQKIYAAAMSIENTRYTRQREQREDKAAGMGQINDAADVLTHERGTPTQITEFFIGMARAAGMNAYAMWVPDRSEDLFTPMWLSTRQLDDTIAVVTVDGKDRFFDPGCRYCPFGQLAWQHTMVEGLRQTDSGTVLGQTPFESYKFNKVTRVANLTMTAGGEVKGKIDLTYTGAPAVRWRQAALRGDGESVRKELREHAEQMVPKTLELEVEEVKNLTEYDKPLAFTLKVSGTLGSATGKRVLLPADLFLANRPATFPHEKRETAVYFDFPEVVQDAVRVNLPQGLAIEATPANGKYALEKSAYYGFDVAPGPTNFTTRRDFVFGDVLVMPKDYPSLRTFYAELESKDQEPVILKLASTPATSAAAGTTGGGGGQQ